MAEREQDGLADAVAGRSELDVLVEQLDELLAEPVVFPEEAVEVATVAGLAQRLGARDDDLAEARRWLADGGRDLVEQGLEETDWNELVETLDNLEGADEHDVEEALSDFDDAVAAAAFVGRTDLVKEPARRVAGIVRLIPDPFAFLSPTGDQMMACRVIAMDLSLYDYWLAVSEASSWT